MKAEITLEQLYWNPQLAEFFLSGQAKDELDDIYSEFGEKGLDRIEFECDQMDIDMDGLNDILHNETHKEIINYFGL